MPLGVKTLKAQCSDCKAEYAVEQDGHGNLIWLAATEDAPCADPNCTGKVAMWPDEIKPGTWWTCKECGGVSELQLRVAVKGVE
jgi:hypothetical protein